MMAPAVAHRLVFFLLVIVLASGSNIHRSTLQRKEALYKSTEEEIEFSGEDDSMPASFSHTDTLKYIPTINPTITGPPTIKPTPPASIDPSRTTTATQPTIVATTSSGGAWCIASPGASQTALQVALDYSCGYGGADCSAIQPGGSCYNPNTVSDHASYAFNSYYQKNPTATSCVFGGTAELTYTDPSSGNCHYISPATTGSPATPAIQSPPSPIISGIPTGGATVIGEPTGSPNMAASTEQNLLLVTSVTIILMYALVAKHI